MDNFDEIKNVWQNQKMESLPSISSINKAIKGYHNSRKREIVFLVFLSVICLTAMIWVMVDYKSNLWTTRIGESLFIGIGLYLFFSKYKLLQKNKQEELLSASDYLDALKKKSEKEALNKSQPILFMILSIGFFFYLYEMLSESKPQLIFGYSILFLFLIFTWFVYRPFKIKSRQNKIQNLLTKIDHLKNQTNEKD